MKGGKSVKLLAVIGIGLLGYIVLSATPWGEFTWITKVFPIHLNTTTAMSLVTRRGSDKQAHSDTTTKPPFIMSRIPEMPPARTDLKVWTFTKQVQCQNLSLDTKNARRYALNINCGTGKPVATVTETKSINVTSFPFGDQCLADFIDKHCMDGNPVPNVLHYVWYGQVEVKFHHFISFMSAARFMKPCLIIFHGEHLPYGKYWDYFTSTFYRLVHVIRPLVVEVHGKKLSFKEHGADVMRIEALQRYGGLYIDSDSVILRSVDDLRKNNCTMGHEYPNALGNQFIMARKQAQFLHLWHEEYKNYRTGNWGHNSLHVPYQISLKHPSLIHIVNKFTKPNYNNLPLIFQKNYNWTENYAMHLYIRMYKTKTDEVIVRKLNTTYGSVSRHILYGDKEMCL